MDARKIIHEWIGWLGMILLLIGYFLVSFSYLSADSWVYQAINIVGSFGILWISFIKKAYQPAVMNVIWAVVAIIALLRIIL